MKRGRSTGNKTKAQLVRLGAIKDIDRIALHHTYLKVESVRAKLWGMAAQNRRVA